ncbi:MAG TPA: UDP-N-acetylglucosamine 2-epimerase (non-hydrolyzing) [Armatimonadota bacterium]|jgi:UDP-N-acetylglucosamine 2-epimerase (non-hydrolysing)
MSFKVINVAGARPNFPKIGPIMSAMRADARFLPLLVHTGQHYDISMSDVFFRDLGIPAPDISLEVGSASHAVQTAAIMVRFEQVVLEQKPDLVLVVGDVNSTVACSLVSAKLGVPVAHVEAGLRSRDRAMPEEINRLVTDALADFLLTPSPDASANLRSEGVPESKIHCVGNVMIDSLLASLPTAARSTVLTDLGVKPSEYGVVTLHRPSNVDEPETLERVLDALINIDFPLVFPAHPRTLDRLNAAGLMQRLERSQVRLTEPLGYLDFLQLTANARLVLTDSGGLQEETTALGIPCLTLRENTERPITVDEGTNTVVGTDPNRILAEAALALTGNGKAGRIPALWDGHTADRIVQVLAEHLNNASA